MPSVATLKLIGLAIGALALAGSLMWAFLTVKGWHDDSLALPNVTAQRDNAIAAKVELEKYTVGAFNHIETGIEGLGKKWANFETSYTNTRTAIDDAVANFKRATANVSNNPAAGSADDVFLRARLLDILVNPDTHQLGRDPGAGQGGEGAGVSPAAAPAHDLPGRRPAAKDKQGLLVPRAGPRHRSGARRTAQGRRGRGLRLGAKGTGGKVQAGRVGPAVSKPRAEVVVRGPTSLRKQIIDTHETLIFAGLSARVEFTDNG